MALVMMLAGAAAVRVYTAPGVPGAQAPVRFEASVAADPFADPLVRFSLARRETPE